MKDRDIIIASFTAAAASSILTAIFILTAVALSQVNVQTTTHHIYSSTTAANGSQSSSCFVFNIYVPKLGIKKAEVCTYEQLKYLTNCIVAVYKANTTAGAEKIWNKCTAYIEHSIKRGK